MTAEAFIAPEQTAHLTAGVLVGIFAQIGHAAAAVCRIAEMLRFLIALGVLRLSHAVLVDRRGVTGFAGIVAFHAADRDTVIALAADVTFMAALAGAVVSAVVRAVAPSAAHRRDMLQAVAVEVTLLVAQRRRVIRAIAGEMTQRTRGSLVPLAIAQQVAFRAAAGKLMLQTVIHAVAGNAAGRSFMLALAVIVTFRAAGSRRMFLAIAIHMAPVAAGSLIMIHAVTGKVALGPAGLRAVVIHAVALFMARRLAGRLGCVIRSQRTGSGAEQQAQRQQQRKNLFHV